MNIPHRVSRLCRSAALALLGLFLLAAPCTAAHAEHTMPDSAFTAVDGTTILSSEGTSLAERFQATACWTMLPFTVRARLAADNVKIYLISCSEEQISSPRISSLGNSSIRVAALTTHPLFQTTVAADGTTAMSIVPGSGYIEIQTGFSAEFTPGPYRLIHEVGHYMDTAAGASTGDYFAISSSRTWAQYYSRFGSAIRQYGSYAGAAALYSPSECWADAFMLYCTQPDTLTAVSPDLYNYVASSIRSIPVSG